MGEGVTAGVHSESDASVGMDVGVVVVSKALESRRMSTKATTSTATAAPPMISAHWRVERPSLSSPAPAPEAEACVADLRWAI